ncbi:MAG: alpha/beta fold hydrolase [Chloroflexota bacterium]|nr:alpha/beta fold hydrolase [Chloroflexota bacterium]
MAAETSGHYLIDGAEHARTLVLAHGAGAPMDHPWMERVSGLLAGEGMRVVRFEFPYMAARRTTGKRPGPNPSRVLEAAWREVIDDLGAERLVIGGKSMGGRIASMVAEEARVAGVVCFGYPFHPPGKPDRLRTAHLEAIQTPVLILQGERDTFGRREEVAGYGLSEQVRVHWLVDGDHGLKPRKASGRTEAENLAEAVREAARFVFEVTGG